MSVSFMWEVVKPSKARCFAAGTSSDVEALRSTFGGEIITTDHISILLAMHRATHQEKSLWSEIAATLERLQGDDFDKVVSLRVWTEY